MTCWCGDWPVSLSPLSADPLTHCNQQWCHWCHGSTQAQAMRAAANLWHHRAAVWRTSGLSPLSSVRDHEEPATTLPTSTASGLRGWTHTARPPTALPPRWRRPGSRETTSGGATCVWGSEEEKRLLLPSCRVWEDEREASEDSVQLLTTLPINQRVNPSMTQSINQSSSQSPLSVMALWHHWDPCNCLFFYVCDQMSNESVFPTDWSSVSNLINRPLPINNQ